MSKLMTHPCQFSPEVAVELRSLIRPGERIYDPFAGPGVRLAALCDEIGATFTGGDIEEWPGHDHRVVVASALDATTYPTTPFTVVTSPVYVHKRCADYCNGPTPTTKTKGRRDYGIALGRALHPDNLARTTGRPARAADYWRGHADAVKCWGDRVIVNVDEPIVDGWVAVLTDAGYEIAAVVPAFTRRYGGLDNARLRAAFEVVLVAERS
jgi:hypothetical protein